MKNVPVIKRRFFKTLLLVITILAIVIVGAAMLLMPTLVDYYQNCLNQVLDYAVVVFLWITGVPLLVILFHFWGLSRSLVKGKVFMDQSIKQIMVIQWCLLIEIGLYVYASLTYHTILAIVILFGATLCEVFASVVRELLVDGMEYYIDSTYSI